MSAIKDCGHRLVRRVNSRPAWRLTRPAACRIFSSAAPQSTTGGVRVSKLFTALLALGVGATGLGLYEFYTSLTLWPEQIRGDLRAGIKAKNQGDLALSERYITRAFQTALALPYQTFAPDPYLKITGIASLLSEVASDRRSREALIIAWSLVGAPSEQYSLPPDAEKTSSAVAEGASGWNSYTLGNEERLRRVALAYKLGQLASERNVDEEEIWLTWAVEDVMKLAALGMTNVHSDMNTKSHENSGSSVFEELELPSWMSKTDLGAPLEALGAFYAKKGKIEYAIPLYLRAISLILPPEANFNVPFEDQCRAAQLMNNLSELIMRRPPTPEVREQAERWASLALEIIQRAQAQPRSSGLFRWGQPADDGREVCEQALGVVLFNLGSLKEMSSDLDGARELFEKSAEQCSKVGLREGIVESQEALRRVEKAKKMG